MVTECEVNRCDFCGFEGENVVPEDFYNPVTKHDSQRYGCRDKKACSDRQDEANKEWAQARRGTCSA